MGYYTDYSLECEDDVPMLPLKEADTWEEMVVEFLEEDFNVFEQDCKWYSWKKDMCLFSKQFPEKLFILDGEGEESVDIWRCYFKGGKFQLSSVVIKFGDFDESKLLEL